MIVTGWNDGDLQTEVAEPQTGCEIPIPPQVYLKTLRRHNLHILMLVDVSCSVRQTLNHLSFIGS